MSNKALIIVDIQNDFVEGGSLGVEGGNQVAEKVAKLITEQNDYSMIVTTQDWHIDPGSHFSDNPDFVNSWPVHCVAGEFGSDFAPGLKKVLPQVETLTIHKGMYADDYSGFEGETLDGEKLIDVLNVNGVTEVEIVGLAENYCVSQTAISAIHSGLEKVTILSDYTEGIGLDDPTEFRKNLNETYGIEYK